MKLIESVYELLLEAAPEEIYKKYYSDIDRDIFLKIIQLDPQSKVVSNDTGGIKRIGKYSKVLLKLQKLGVLKSEDYPKAKEYLELIYKHKVPVDINKIEKLSDLFTLVERFYSSDGDKNVFDLINLLTEDDYELLLSGDQWLIYTPKSEKGAAYLGHNTQWCTAWGPYSTNKSLRERNSHFASHNNKGPLYVIIPRNEPKEKYQFHFETNQFMTYRDAPTNIQDFFDLRREVTNYFFPSLIDDTPVDPIEFERMDNLPDNLMSILLRKEIGETDNQLVDLLINFDDGDEMSDILLEKYIDDPIVEDLEWNFPKLIFTVSEIGDGCERTMLSNQSYNDNAGHYSQVGENLRNDISDSDDEFLDERLSEILSEFYDKVYTSFDNKENFIKTLLYFYRNDLIDDLADEHVDKNYNSVMTANQSEADKIERYINISEDRNSFEVVISPYRLGLFINKEGLSSINDVTSLLDEYVSHYDIDYDYEDPMYEIGIEFPDYKDMKSHIEGYVQKLDEELSENPDCIKESEEFISILEKYFTRYYGFHTFKSEHVEIEIRDRYNCEKGIRVNLKMLKTNETYKGYLSKEKLLEYLTIEPLLEKN